MKNIKDITSVFNIHGDENYPITFMHLFNFHIANQKAKQLGIRYIEEDMNRIWNTLETGTSIEHTQAQKLYQKIKDSKYLLDFHLTTADQEDCVICLSLNNYVLDIAKLFGINYILILDDNNNSLISKFNNAVSIEISKHNLIYSLNRIIPNIKNHTQTHNKPLILRQIGVRNNNPTIIKTTQNLKDYNGIYYSFIGEKAYRGKFLILKKYNEATQNE